MMIEYFVNVNSESIKVNSSHDNNAITINGKPGEIFIRKVNHYLYTVQRGNSITEVVIAGRGNGNITLLIDGYYYFVDSKTRLEQLTEKILAGSDNAESNIVIKAPMPGLILDINVAENDTVQEGDNLIVLEAMKMENIIKSPVNGVVSQIKFNKKDSVEKGYILIMLERKSK